MLTNAEISRLEAVPREITDGLRAELEACRLPWKRAYSDYQSGGWHVAQLLNSSGTLDQLRIDAGNPKPTPLLESFPSVRRWIEESKLDVRIARLAKIDPAAWMHEHTDDVGMKEERMRLHIPIVTNQQAVLCFQGEQVHTAEGWVWKLDHERVPHGAANFGAEERIHLILDCRVTEELQRRLADETLPRCFIRELPKLDLETYQTMILRAREFISAGQRDEGEALLLKTFSTHSLAALSSYDLLLHAYDGILEAQERRAYWTARLKEVRRRDSALPFSG